MSTASSMTACRDCIRTRFEPYNYIWDEEVVPEQHFCRWCGHNKPELIWFKFENRILADQRKREQQKRQQQWQPQKDTRAHYREPWRERD